METIFAFTKRMTKILGIVVMCLGTTITYAQSYNHCHNCSAEVTLPFSKADQLIDTVKLFNFMPLDGKITFVNDDSFPTAKVEIGTLEGYARQYSLDSFDVAKVLKSLASDPQWQIISIAAVVNIIEDSESAYGIEGSSASNVGTIGH